jgi:hypothetical protein
VSSSEYRLYQHVKRPEWGFSTIVSLEDDRTTFLFVDGIQRTFKLAHVHMMELVTTLDDAAAEACRKLAAYATVTARGTVAKVKRPAAKKKPKVAAPPATPPAAP